MPPPRMTMGWSYWPAQNVEFLRAPNTKGTRRTCRACCMHARTLVLQFNGIPICLRCYIAHCRRGRRIWLERFTVEMLSRRADDDDDDDDDDDGDGDDDDDHHHHHHDKNQVTMKMKTKKKND